MLLSGYSWPIPVQQLTLRHDERREPHRARKASTEMNLHSKREDPENPALKASSYDAVPAGHLILRRLDKELQQS
jgi:hypothetical protein